MRASARELLVSFFTPLIWCGNGIRTNDHPLRKGTLYQLSFWCDKCDILATWKLCCILNMFFRRDITAINTVCTVTHCPGTPTFTPSVTVYCRFRLPRRTSSWSSKGTQISTKNIHHQEDQQHHCLPAKKPVNMPKVIQGHLLQNICEASSGICGHSLGSLHHRQHHKGRSCPTESSQICDRRLSLHQQCHCHDQAPLVGKPSNTEDSKLRPLWCSELYMPW